MTTIYTNISCSENIVACLVSEGCWMHVYISKILVDELIF